MEALGGSTRSSSTRWKGVRWIKVSQPASDKSEFVVTPWIQPDPEIRPARVVAGVAVGTASLVMASMADSGFTDAWPGWAKWLLGFGLMFGVLLAVALIANGIGALTSKSLASPVDGQDAAHDRTFSRKQFLAVNAGALCVAVALAYWFEHSYGIHPKRSIEAVYGALFLLASLGHPWWLYRAFRKISGFVTIENDRVMRIVLAVLGIGLIVLALVSEGQP